MLYELYITSMWYSSLSFVAYMNPKPSQALASLTYLQPQIDAIHAKAEYLDVPTPIIDALHELFNGVPYLSFTFLPSNHHTSQISILPNHPIILFDRIESSLPCPLHILLHPPTQIPTSHAAQAHPPLCSALANTKMPKNCSNSYQNVLRMKWEQSRRKD